MRMMGAIQGLKISRISAILIGLACASMIAFACRRTTIVSSFIPNQILVMHPDKLGEDLKGKDKLVETADSVGSSGIEAAEKRENGENSTSTRERDTAVSDGFFGERKQDEIVQEDSLELDSAAVKQTTKLPVSAGEKEGPSVSVERTGSVLSGGKDNSKQLELEMEKEKEKENITTVDSSVRKEQMRNLSAITGNKECNYAKGKWVFDDRRPLYSGFGCKKWLSSMWACRLTQRTDFEYEKLRWQPKDCKMEYFSGSKFLKRMQDKTLAIVGDSLGRQQFQSLMCMVTGGEERRDVVDVGYEYGLVKAHGAVRPDGWAYRFPITNTTILYYWSASLCDLEPINASNKVTDFAMHLDRPPAFLRRFLPKFDVLVLNTGHHWNRGKLNANRWIMYVGGIPNTNRKIAEIGGAKDFAVHSIIKWLDSQLPLYPGLKVFFRSISPRHFFNGDWNTGGTCDNTTPLLGGKEVLKDNSSDPLASSAVRGTSVKLLDITALSELRDEGHVSRYSIKATPGVQDCLHWCLPGVPDTWNEILFAQL